MKTFKISTILIALLALTFITSCDRNDEDDNPTNQTGSVHLEYDLVWAMSEMPFALNTPLYHPMTGDTLTYTKLKFYISNIKLKDMDGNWWSETESYHLLDASNWEHIELTDVPAGHYVELQYTFGVDSARNVSGAQTGALSVSNDMFWSWNSGYIMCKAEGSAGSLGSFSYHLGGFSGTNNVVSVKTTDFDGAHLMLGANETKHIMLSANPAKMFHTYGSVSNGATLLMPGANAVTLASDFSGSFKFTGIE